MILSHHGQLDFGSPKVPMFLEAMLLHLIDNMDSKMEAMRAHVAKDRQATGVWTGYSAPLERIVLKKEQYLESADEPAKMAVKILAEPVKPAAPEPPNSVFAAKLQGALKIGD
jgi:3'-5' exoribonuclease